MKLPGLSHEQRSRIVSINESYRRLTGSPLVAADGDPVHALWAAPLAIVAHGTEPDPVFYFGNRTALALFDMDFGSFTRLASRFSAEPMQREQRADLLERVARDGIISDYAGVRISASGRRFRISEASVWNLTTETGTRVGQAAAFSNWVYVDTLT